MMKKICLILAVLMVLASTLTLFSCGKDEPEQKKPEEQKQEEQKEPEDEPGDDEPKEPADTRTADEIWGDLTPSEGDGDKWSESK